MNGRSSIEKQRNSYQWQQQYNNGGVSVSTMKKVLTQKGIEIEKDTDIIQTYKQAVQASDPTRQSLKDITNGTAASDEKQMIKQYQQYCKTNKEISSLKTPNFMNLNREQIQQTPAAEQQSSNEKGDKRSSFFQRSSNFSPEQSIWNRYSTKRYQQSNNQNLLSDLQESASSMNHINKENYNNNIYERNQSDKRLYRNSESLLATAHALSASYPKGNMQHFYTSSNSEMKTNNFLDNMNNQQMQQSSQKMYERQRGRSSLFSKIQNRVTNLEAMEISIIVTILISSISLFSFYNTSSNNIMGKINHPFCDSNFSASDIQKSGCSACPQNALCLNNEIKCKQPYVLMEGSRCVVNPEIERKAVEYMKYLYFILSQQQANYYCYNSDSPGQGQNFSRPYVEHTAQQIKSYLRQQFSEDELHLDILSKVNEYIQSKNIRDQFDILFDVNRDTFYVTLFNPSNYCKIRLFFLQNINVLYIVVAIMLASLLLYQLKPVRQFLFFLRLFKAQKFSENQDYQEQQPSTPTATNLPCLMPPKENLLISNRSSVSNNQLSDNIFNTNNSKILNNKYEINENPNNMLTYFDSRKSSIDPQFNRESINTNPKDKLSISSKNSGSLISFEQMKWLRQQNQ